MAPRIFKDERGVEWKVLSVEPTWAERRSTDRRRVIDLNDEEQRAFDTWARDRRTSGDRRRGYYDAVPRERLSSPLTGGWLAFDGGGERRRLAPVPPDWDLASDAELLELLKRATPVHPYPGSAAGL